MNPLRILLVALVTVLLFGLQACATMSEAECNNADWEMRGEDDGESGYRRDRVNSHSEACAEYGIKPDLNAYAKGWQRGITEFCTRDNGWEHGLTGNTYQKSCPTESHASFFAAYSLGAAIYQEQSNVTSLESSLDSVRDDLDDEEDKDKRAKLRKKRDALKVDLAEAEADLLRAKLEAQKQGFTPP